ncbi:PilN domain-containing protein [Thiocapsa roseopersicina]|uniref:Type IV pilus assembly protein PilN n=1 Tax=Thiocapsa roseopersicina TaxID=1058 RepID=A0A1H2ZCZ3_THIRO|nr:PilN domain-containing protein [Thiocapsa roseopersicina]SDX14858.1 type IV pilus assembly protein PilN [Thiocapsa roseopersicina]
MTRINLLPWREEARQRRRKEFAAAGGLALVFTLLLAVLVHLEIEGRIGNQQARNQLLEGEIAQLNRQIKEIEDLEKIKADLLSRMEIIQQLQESRPEIVRLFDELVVAIPEGVYLTKLEQNGRAVVVEGRAQSNARVSAFMRSIEASQWIGSPRLLLIEDKTGTGLSQFRLAFDQVSPETSPASTQTDAPEDRRSGMRLMADSRR